MQIPFEGKISKPIFEEVFNLQKAPPRKIFVSVFIKCLAIATSVFIVLYGNEKARFAACLLIGFFLIDIWNLFKWKYNFLNEVFEQSGNKSFKGHISENLVTFMEDNSNIEFNWDAYTKYKFKDSILLLYLNNNRYEIFHKSWFQSEDDWQDLIELTEIKIPPFDS